jgi:hypothetical protein
VKSEEGKVKVEVKVKSSGSKTHAEALRLRSGQAQLTLFQQITLRDTAFSPETRETPKVSVLDSAFLTLLIFFI